MGTQATASTKGYTLQDYFGIYFFFENENYKKIDSIKLEGEEQDIEIFYKDKSRDYIQVKTQENPMKKNTFNGEAFKKGIEILYETYNKLDKKKIKINRLILSTNMLNQGIKRLTNKIENGLEENFIYNIFEHCSADEIKKFQNKISPLIIDKKFFLSRIDESFYFNSSKSLLELKSFLEKIGIVDTYSKVFNDLKTLFRENSCQRNKVIIKKDIAWIIIKNRFYSDPLEKQFNDIYEDKLSELGFLSIQDILEEYNINNILEKYLNFYELYLQIESQKIQFSIKEKEKISLKNIKIFLDKVVKIFSKNNYLNFEENNEETKLIYAYLGFCIYKKNKENFRIYDELEIKETK
ncbi:hypothetical protein LDK12_00515 [Fusobacterium pseudoperiodonticum]|jgi:hypothetical protein|uniref:hypothetical protein n=1 Tax=Fusobacterium pseudoperiodonticum TaxID=2663009 RepID=UPI0030CB29B0